MCLLPGRHRRSDRVIASVIPGGLTCGADRCQQRLTTNNGIRTTFDLPLISLPAVLLLNEVARLLSGRHRRSDRVDYTVVLSDLTCSVPTAAGSG